MNMTKCYRCHKPMIEPDLKEAIAREEDWRNFFPDEDNTDRVLICNACADTLAEFEE